MTSSTEQTETIVNPTPMDTSTETPVAKSDEKPIEKTSDQEQKEEKQDEQQDHEQAATENKAGKRKRPTKQPVEGEENNTSVSSGRPRRTLTKREDLSTSLVNGAQAKTPKTKSVTQAEEKESTADDADDEQEREKNIPVQHDVGDLLWVKMGGHPWWPSIIIRDPNDANHNFTKITGNARPKRLYFVSFYGSTADFAWVSDTAMIPYKGVEAFTQYAQELVDQATTKSQKEHFTERFQLKVTIGRREDWESAVREADGALKQTNETRLREIEPKLGFYSTKTGSSAKSQQGRRAAKSSGGKSEETSSQNDLSTLNPTDRSLLAEKTFEFKSEDENENDPSMEMALRKQTPGKAHIPRVNGNANETTSTPPKKRRNVRQSAETSKTTVYGQNANGSSVSYDQRTSETNETPTKKEKVTNGTPNSGKKRGRPNSKQMNNVSSSSEESPAPEFHSTTPSVTMKFTTQRKPIIKPQAFSNPSTNNDVDGKNDIRTGFLTASEEQEVLDALEQLKSTKTFEEAEQVAKRRFEHILCLNLNRTHVDVPQEWFYTFLFSHPSLIMKNSHWFNEKIDENPLNESEKKVDDQKSNSLLVLKNQLAVLSKLYRNELELRSASPVKKRQATGGKGKQRKGVAEVQSSADEMANDSQGEELIN